MGESVFYLVYTLWHIYIYSYGYGYRGVGMSLLFLLFLCSMRVYVIKNKTGKNSEVQVLVANDQTRGGRLWLRLL